MVTEYGRLRMQVSRYLTRHPWAMPMGSWSRVRLLRGRREGSVYRRIGSRSRRDFLADALPVRRGEDANGWWVCGICGGWTIWGGSSRRWKRICSDQCYRLIKVRRVSMADYKRMRRELRRSVQLQQLLSDVKRKVKAYEAHQRHVSEGVRGPRQSVHQGHA